MDIMLLKTLIIVFIYNILITKKIVNGANILAVFPSVWKSHYIYGYTILTELINYGHNITMISAYNSIDKLYNNYTEIKVNGIEQNWIDMGLSFKFDEIRDKSIVERVTAMIYTGTSNADLILSSTKVQDLLKSKQKFDLLIGDLYLSDALLGLANYYKIPTIVLSSTDTNKWLDEMTGNTHNSAINPNSFLPFLDNMTLKERILNTLMTIFEKFTYSFFHILYQQSIYQRHFEQYLKNDEQLPPLMDLVHNVSLVLLNTHPVVQYPRSYITNMVDVGGAHIKRENGKLPKTILDHIKSSKNGVIYVSFGANLQTKDLPPEKLLVLLETFKSLEGKMSVILKWEDSNLDYELNNTLISSWLPQQDILAHENVKIFISTAGLLSTMEAIRYKTPVIGIPIVPDQEVNIKRLERLGCGKEINYESLTSKNLLLQTINEIMSNNLYQENIEKASKLFQDNLDNPLDKAIYYINYVLKTDGAKHLRSNSVELGFIKSELIDVIIIILAGLVAILAVPSLIICVILRKSNSYMLLENKVIKEVKSKTKDKSKKKQKSL